MLPAATYVFSWNPRDRLTRISSEDRSKVYRDIAGGQNLRAPERLLVFWDSESFSVR